MELSGLELRTAIAVALEWRWVRLNRHDTYCYYMPPEAAMRYRDAEESDSRRPMSLPLWESDPAAFWPEFEKWLQVTPGACASMHTHLWIGRRKFTVYALDKRGGTIEAEMFGDTILEAGCRAWLTAMQQRKAERP